MNKDKDEFWSSHRYDPQNWQSLDPSENNCLITEYSNVLSKKFGTGYVDPCAKPSPLCEKFCRNSKIFAKHILSNQNLQNVIYQFSHPTETDRKGNKLVPFCYGGDETEQFNSAVAFRNFNLTTEYDFCKHATQRITDIGVCTTVDFQDF